LQILDGLSYLESEGLEFPCLSCDNVLLSLVGDVKISESAAKSGRGLADGDAKRVKNVAEMQEIVNIPM
jgi:hypothetical protein